MSASLLTMAARLTWSCPQRWVAGTSRRSATLQDLFLTANAAIRSITFPDTLKEMSGLPLFHECENLETITIPASVTGMHFHSVADCFIFNCPNLKTIIFKGTRAQWEAIEKEYCEPGRYHGAVQR